VIPSLLSEPNPTVRFIRGFGATSSLDFAITYRVGEITDPQQVLLELIRRVFKRFKSDGIPSPAGAVCMKTEPPETRPSL